MDNITQLQISYPDFQLNTVIDPEQFDTNNLEIVTKINEMITSLSNVNSTKIPTVSITGITGTNIQDVLVALKTYVDAGNTSLANQIANLIIGVLPGGVIGYTNLSSDLKDRIDANYVLDVVSVDANNKPTHTTYKRLDDSLYKDVTCSNADTNGYYQTVVEKTYDTNGTTLLQTKTYTLTFNADGIITHKGVVIV